MKNAVSSPSRGQQMRQLINEYTLRNLMRAQLAVTELDALGISVVDVDLNTIGVPKITVAPNFRCRQLRGVQTGISLTAEGRMVHFQATLQDCQVCWKST